MVRERKREREGGLDLYKGSTIEFKKVDWTIFKSERMMNKMKVRRKNPNSNTDKLLVREGHEMNRKKRDQGR